MSGLWKRFYQPSQCSYQAHILLCTSSDAGVAQSLSHDLCLRPVPLYIPFQRKPLPYYYVNGYVGTDVEAAKATAYYETYGVLYNWPAVMTEGICPSGWHIQFFI